MKFTAILILMSLTAVLSKCSSGADSYSCDDMKMFQQCSSAQSLITDWIIRTAPLVYSNDTHQQFVFINSTPMLKCSDSIVCTRTSDWNPPNHCRALFCQNLKSYNKCLMANSLLRELLINHSISIQDYPLPSFECSKLASDCIYDDNHGTSQTHLNVLLSVFLIQLSIWSWF